MEDNNEHHVGALMGGRRCQLDQASDQNLVYAASYGSQDAISALWQRYRGYALTIARAMLEDDADIDAAATDGFNATLGRFGGIRLGFKPYVAQCVRNAARDITARRARSIPQADPEDLIDPTVETPDEHVVLADDYGTIAASFAELTTAQQEVLRLRDVEGLTNAETARHLDMNEDAVSQAHRRALSSLAAAYLARRVGAHQVTNPTCRSVRGRLRRYYQGHLPASRADKVAEHLATCVGCAKVAREARSERLYRSTVPALSVRTYKTS